MTEDQIKKRQMYLFLLILAVGSTAAFQGWRTLLNNFAVDVAGLNGFGMGIVQSIREVPGFLAMMAIYVILIIREHKLAALAVMILGLGVVITGFMPSLIGIVISTLTMSFGFHYYETMNQSLTLQYFNRTEAPVVMGKLRSFNALTNIVIGLFIYLISDALNFTQMFCILGGLAIAAGAWALTRDPSRQDLPLQNKKMVFKGKYWLYYALTFFSGARRQIFVAFAIFLMVEKFNFTIQQVTALFVFNNVVNYFVSPRIGKAINRFGERNMMTLEYTALGLIFLGYAFSQSGILVALLYVVNNIFYGFAMGIQTFYQKIADPEDIASGMAVGFTINHISAVCVPFLGGLLWVADYQAVFIGAALLALISLLLVQMVPGQIRKMQSPC